MKFILQEDKFILAETQKFLLEERITLTEATATEIAAKWTEQLLKTFSNTEAVLTKYLEYATISKDKSNTHAQKDAWKTAIEKADENLEVMLRQPLAEINSSVDKVKENFLSCINVLTEAETELTKTPENAATITSLKKLVGFLKNLQSLPTWNAGQVTKAKQALTQLLTIKETLFDTEELNSDINAVQEFKKDCTECLKLLKDIKTTLTPSFDFTKIPTEDLTAYQTEVKRIIDSIQLKDATTLNKGLVVANFEIYWKQVKTLLTSYKAIQDIVNYATVDRQQDWKTKLAKAVNKDTVIQEFIYTTWPKQAAKVLKIKKAFLSECEAYGFSTTGANPNPFISFINEVYLKYGDLVTPEKYNIIHNLAADNFFTGADLTGKGDMKQGNIVFCKAFYSLNSEVMKAYAVKQANLLKAANKDSKFKTNAEMTFNALYAVSEIVTGSATEQGIDMALRSMNDIERLEERWTGKVSDITKKTSPDTKIATNAELINQIKTTENAVKVIAALAIKFSSDNTILAAAQSCKEVRELMAQTTTIETIRSLVASVENLYGIKQINASKAISLIKSILESDQFTLTLE